MANLPGGLPIPVLPSSAYPNQAVEILNMENEIYYINPDQTPILTILNQLGKQDTPLHEMMWPEDEHYRMSFGKAKLTYLGKFTTTTGSRVYHACKILVSKQVERQAFRESLSLKMDTAAAQFLDQNGSTTGYYDHFKVKFAAGTLHASAIKYAYVLSSLFAEQNSGVAGTWAWNNNDHATYPYTTTAAEKAVFTGTDAAKTKQPVVNHKGEIFVFFVEDPTALGGYEQTSYFPFETVSPTDAAGAWQEGTGLGGRTHKRSRFLWAHTEITKTVYSASGTVMAEVGLGGETQYLRDRAAAASEHKLAIEKKVMFRAGATGRGTDTRGMRGLGIGWDGTENADGDIPFIISKNGSYDTRFQWTVGSASSEDDLFALWDMLEWVWEDRMSNDITLMVSPKFNNIVNKLLMTTDQTRMLVDEGMTMAGLSVQKLKTPNGNVNWMVHNSIRGPWEDYCLALNFDDITFRPLRGRDTQLWVDCEPKSIDATVDYFMTETCIQVKKEHEHAIIKVNS